MCVAMLAAMLIQMRIAILSVVLERGPHTSNLSAKAIGTYRIPVTNNQIPLSSTNTGEKTNASTEKGTVIVFSRACWMKVCSVDILRNYPTYVVGIGRKIGGIAN